MFDSQKQGRIEKEKVKMILNTMVHNYDDLELDRMVDSEDAEGEPKEVGNRLVRSRYVYAYDGTNEDVVELLLK